MRRSSHVANALASAAFMLAGIGCDGLGAGSQVSPEAQLRAALEYLEKLPAFKFDADIAVNIDVAGRSQMLDSEGKLLFEKPDKFALTLEGGMAGVVMMSDGKQLVRYMPMMNRYSLEELGDAKQGGMGAGQVLELVRSFDANKAFTAIRRLLTNYEYVGRETIDGVECHHCRYESTHGTLDAWFETGDRPLVRKVVADMTKTLVAQAGIAGRSDDVKMVYAVTLKDWDTAPKFTAADFTFTPPEGAEKADTLAARGANARPVIHPLVGQPAPPFEVPNLEGKTISLADYLGKNVIVLDFWATWCGPCVAALPEINEVGTAFKDRGVVFYAVNLGDDRQTVVDFLNANNLDLPVALDERNAVGRAYGAMAIPQTVLIGKDGKVQVVHVGFGGNLKELLTSELEQLLAGKDLATETIAKAAEEEAKRKDHAAQ